MPEGTPVSIEDVIQKLAELQTFVVDKVSSGQAPMEEEVQKLSASYLALQATVKEMRREKVKHISSEGKMMVTEGRLMGFDSLELSILKGIMARRHEPEMGYDWLKNTPIGVEIMKSREQLVEAANPENIYAWAERAEKERRTAYGMKDNNPGMLRYRDDLHAWRASLMDIARRKAMDSTTSGTGDELVPTIEAAQLWMDVNLDTVILPVLQQVPMPSQPFDMPTQLGAPNWYPGVENVQAITSDLSTAKVTLDAKTLRAGVPFSDELDEDAIIAIVPEIRREITRSAAEVIDDVLLNGDQTAANGINSDGATIGTDTAGKAHWLLGFDGLIHLPIVDNTSQANNHSAGVTADMFSEIQSKLGKYGSPKRRGDLVFISDINTAIRSLSITEFETVDVAGPRATISSGEFLSVYGIPYLHSAQMRLADTDGKVTSAGNSAETGRLLLVNTTQWRVGFRRQVSVEPDREPGKGQTTIYISFRIALTERSGTRSSATHTAMQYNITGVA
jgi:HK97 family phage major capsid protein